MNSAHSAGKSHSAKIAETGHSWTQSAQSGFQCEPFLQLNSTEAVKEAVAAGLGVSIVSGLAIKAEVALKRLTVVAIKGVHLRRPVYRVTRKSVTDTKAVIAFLYMLKHAVRGSLPELNQPITPAR